MQGHVLCWFPPNLTHRAAILQDCVTEAAVSFCLQVKVIGSLENYGFLQVSILLVIIGHGVLAVVSDALRGLFR